MHKTKHPLYSAWLSMLNRCRNPNHPKWSRYGGRGIRVCDEWRDFERWLSDMGEKPSPKHSIERIDNDGNYEPGNCRWATQPEQLRNRANNRWVTIDGEKHLACDLAAKSGLKADTIIERASKGLSMAEVLSPDKRVYLAGLALGGHANGERQRARTHCSKGHEFTPENTRITPEGWRNCRACHNEKMRRRTAAKRATARAVPAAPA